MVLRNFFLAACLLVVGGSLNAQAATLLSDNFNSENGGVGVLNYAGFANWNVTTVTPSLGTGTGTVDLIGNGYYDFYPGNGLYVDLDGSTDNAGALVSKQAFDLKPGTYTLSFDLGGSTRGDLNLVDVSLGSVYSQQFAVNSSDPFALVTENITVGSDDPNAFLSFHNEGGDDFGAILDNVTLQSNNVSGNGNPVPEPSTIALMFVGLVGASVFAIRRKLLFS